MKTPNVEGTLKPGVHSWTTRSGNVWRTWAMHVHSRRRAKLVQNRNDHQQHTMTIVVQSCACEQTMQHHTTTKTKAGEPMPSKSPWACTIRDLSLSVIHVCSTLCISFLRPACANVIDQLNAHINRTGKTAQRIKAIRGGSCGCYPGPPDATVSGCAPLANSAQPSAAANEQS